MKILFIGGSLNQTSMMHKISLHLGGHDCYFTPYYADGFIHFLTRLGLLKNTILGGRHYRDTMEYLQDNNLSIDLRGAGRSYDLVVTGSDAIIQDNIKHSRIVLVQEGMTEPEGLAFHLVRLLKLPRWMGNTSTTGLSNAYDAFCVASEGYKELFIKKGVYPEKLIVTGIPNFDNLADIPETKFPYRKHVLVATTPFRETMRPELRPLFIRKCVEIANGRQLIFKLHPLENAPRAIREINRFAPDAKVFWRGNVNAMMLHADAVITQWSSSTFVALALGKEVYSDLDITTLKKIMPIQNEGKSAENIAQVCQTMLDTALSTLLHKREEQRIRHPHHILDF
jgi:hypothetical protein